jgi:hypothetical protein
MTMNSVTPIAHSCCDSYKHHFEPADLDATMAQLFTLSGVDGV